MPDGLALGGRGGLAEQVTLEQRSEGDEGGSHAGFRRKSVSVRGAAGAKAANGPVPSLGLIFFR